MGAIRDATIGTVATVIGGIAIAGLSRAGVIDQFVRPPALACPREDNDSQTNYEFAPTGEAEVLLKGEDEGIDGEVSFKICRDASPERAAEFWYFGRNQQRETTLRPASFNIDLDQYETDPAVFPFFFVRPGSCEFGFLSGAEAAPASYFCEEEPSRD